MKPTELLPQEEKRADKEHLSNNVVDLKSIKSIIERDFQDAIKNRSFGNESHLREELTDFLKLILSADVKVDNEVKTDFGILDILINGKYILELKYADNKGTLDKGIAEVKRYKELGKKIIMVILKVRTSNRKDIEQYTKWYREEGAEVIILKVRGKRKKANVISTKIKEFMKVKKIITVDWILKNFEIKRKTLRKLLYRLSKQGWIERIEKGKYMIIPLGAEKGKYTLNEFVIGSLLVTPYAISYWSALNYYGMTEQIPSTVFIQTTSWKKKQEIDVFGVKYKLVRIKKEKVFGLRTEWIEETEINITDREKTIIDCLDKPQYCGGVVEVAKALRKENLDHEKIVKYAREIGNSGVIRRLGYLCDFLRIDIDVPMIETRNYLLLDPTMPHKGKKDAKWRVIVNLDERILGKLE